MKTYQPNRSTKIYDSSGNRLISRRSITRWSRAKRYNNVYFERTFRKQELERLVNFRNQIDSITIPVVSADANLVFNLFIELINTVTVFYDAGPIRTITEKNLIDDFNDFIKVVVRRNSDVPTGYRNRSIPGEKVTDKNLLFGDAEKISGTDLKSNCIIKEYMGEKYKIHTTMHPISRWRKGNVRNVQNKKVAIRPQAILSTMRSIQDELLSECDSIIEKYH